MHLQVYVDDPIAILQGDEKHRKRMACMVIVMWSLMGFPIATHKATLSNSLVWIGVQLQVDPTQVVAEVPAAKVQELDSLLAAAVERNLVSKKSLRTLIGKAMAIAQSSTCGGLSLPSSILLCMHSKQRHHRAVSGPNRLNLR